MTDTRRYSATWAVTIEVTELPGANAQQRHAYQEDLMLRMHVFLADRRVDQMLREHLGTLADDRTVEHVIVTPISATHPDNAYRE